MFDYSIVHKLVGPTRFYQDVPQQLIHAYKDIPPGTMALLSLLICEDQNADRIHVAWRTAHDHRVDVLTIDEAQPIFTDPGPA